VSAAGGRADQVAENGCDQLSFFGDDGRRLCGRDRRAAREAELRDVGIFLPTLDADGHGERVRPSVGWF
jgi:hypothetical protein